MSLPVRSLDLSTLGSLTLRTGENDARHKWGGQFDNFLSPNGEDYEAQHFFAQRCFHLHHPMRVLG